MFPNMALSAGECLFPDLQQASAAPALANAAMIAAKGCTHTYISVLQALYSTNHLPMPDFSILSRVEVTSKLPSTDDLAPKDVIEQDTVNDDSLEEEHNVFKDDFYATAIASPTAIGDFEDWIDETKDPIVARRMIAFPETVVEVSTRDPWEPQPVWESFVSSSFIDTEPMYKQMKMKSRNITPVVAKTWNLTDHLKSNQNHVARRSRLPSAVSSTPVENADTACDISEKPITADPDTPRIQPNTSKNTSDFDIWGSQDSSPWANAIAPDGYSYEGDKRSSWVIIPSVVSISPSTSSYDDCDVAIETSNETPTAVGKGRRRWEKCRTTRLNSLNLFKIR